MARTLRLAPAPGRELDRPGVPCRHLLPSQPLGTGGFQRGLPPPPRRFIHRPRTAPKTLAARTLLQGPRPPARGSRSRGLAPRFGGAALRRAPRHPAAEALPPGGPARPRRDRPLRHPLTQAQRRPLALPRKALAVYDQREGTARCEQSAATAWLARLPALVGQTIPADLPCTASARARGSSWKKAATITGQSKTTSRA